MQYQYRKHFHMSIILHMQYIAEYPYISQAILYDLRLRVMRLILNIIFGGVIIALAY